MQMSFSKLFFFFKHIWKAGTSEAGASTAQAALWLGLGAACGHIAWSTSVPMFPPFCFCLGFPEVKFLFLVAVACV